jgi:hypothetical protein
VAVGKGRLLKERVVAGAGRCTFLAAAPSFDHGPFV